MVVRSFVVASVLLQLTVCTRPPGAASESASRESRECQQWVERQKWPQAAESCLMAAHKGDARATTLAVQAYVGARSPEKALAVARELKLDDAATILRLRAQAGEAQAEAPLWFASALIIHAAQQRWDSAAGDLYWWAALLRKKRMHEAVEALELSGTLARRSHSPHDESLAGLGLAYIYTRIGDVTRADHAFSRVANVEGRTARDRAWWSLLYAGHLLAQLQLADAKSAYEQALLLAETGGFEDIGNSAHLNLARLAAEDGDTASAKRHLAAYDLHPEPGTEPIRALVAGMIAFGEHELVDAEALLAKAAENPLDDDYAWDIAYTRGCVAEQQGDLVTAERHFRSAVAGVELVRSNMTSLGLRPLVLAHRREPYEALFSLRAAQGRKHDALEVVELLHARTWSDAAAAIDLEHAPTVKMQSLEEMLAASRSLEGLVFMRARGSLWRLHVVRGEVVELVSLPNVDDEIKQWRSQPEDVVTAARLGAALLPARLTVDRDRPLYIVAPELGDVPFAALRRGDRYLIEQRELVRLPGLAVASCRAAAPADGPPVIVADSRGDLAAAREEASYVASLMGSVADIGSAATRDRILKGSHARLLFVAAHARVGERGGSLILQDGDFTAEDILKHGVAPKVAVLAGCATGDSQAPEGWGALSSSLLAAGTRSVVATLRPVADTPTSKIMRAFFDAHGDTRPSAALAAAQRANLEMRTRDWASFAVWGAASPDECQ